MACKMKLAYKNNRKIIKKNLVISQSLYNWISENRLILNTFLPPRISARLADIIDDKHLTIVLDDPVIEIGVIDWDKVKIKAKII